MKPHNKRVRLTKTDLSLFPPLEYLNIIVYFSADLRQPGGLLGSWGECIGSRFSDDVVLDSEVGLSVTRSDRPSENSVGPWTFSDDVNWYRYNNDDVDLMAISRSPDVFPGGIKWVSVYAEQQGHRAPRSLMAFDHVWCISLDAYNSYPMKQADCTAVLSVATHLFSGWGKESTQSTRFADDIVRAAVRAGDVYYAFVLTSSYRDDNSGWSYSDAGPNSPNIRFGIENDLWREAREGRRGKVRGVYSGQYLSPVHLTALGGKERFIDDLIRVRDRRDDIVTDLGDKGMILRVTPTPIDGGVYGIGIGGSGLGTFIFRRFREAGLFL